MNFAKKTQKGFTLVELMISVAVFSIVLIVFMAALLRVSQLFYKGVTMSKTQETARTVLQDITDDIQFYHQQPTTGPGYICVGNHRYSYNLGVQAGAGAGYALVRETLTSCKSVTDQPPSASAEELLDPGMQVNKLSVSPVGTDAYNINMLMVYYGTDPAVLISPSGATPAWKAADARCAGSANSTEYCTTAEYNSTILQKF